MHSDSRREGLLYTLGAEGVYARTRLHEDVASRLMALISTYSDQDTEVLLFPPVMSRRALETSGYLRSFPNLLGCVCTLDGDEAAIRSAADLSGKAGDWTTAVTATDLVLIPAACYPLYPLVADRPRLPVDGARFDVVADCFRREPSSALDRLQSFRMREFVCIGTASQALAFRESWMDKAIDFVRRLSLPWKMEVASDPFFGRIGRVMAFSQRQQSLKYELRIPYSANAVPTACMSFNYHRDNFGQIWKIVNGLGEVAHSSCVGFGIERLVMAMFCIHGKAVSDWPTSTRNALGFEGSIVR